jgi:hypothetical protein
VAMESWIQLLHTVSYAWVEPVYQCLVVYDIEIIKREGQYWHLVRCRSDGETQTHGPFRSVEAAIEDGLAMMEGIYRAWDTEAEVA